MKKPIIFIILLIVLAVGFSLAIKRHQYHPGPQIILYYSKQCPGCAQVEEFLQKHVGARRAVPLQKKEITTNRDNLLELIRVEKYCHMPVKQYVIIPLLWTGKDCISGQDNIIKFFKEQIKQ